MQCQQIIPLHSKFLLFVGSDAHWIEREKDCKYFCHFLTEKLCQIQWIESIRLFEVTNFFEVFIDFIIFKCIYANDRIWINLWWNMKRIRDSHSPCQEFWTHFQRLSNFLSKFERKQKRVIIHHPEIIYFHNFQVVTLTNKHAVNIYKMCLWNYKEKKKDNFEISIYNSSCLYMFKNICIWYRINKYSCIGQLDALEKVFLTINVNRKIVWYMFYLSMKLK